MNYLVHAVKNPTSLWVGRVTKCANPILSMAFWVHHAVFFFAIWIVVTVSVGGDSPNHVEKANRMTPRCHEIPPNPTKFTSWMKEETMSQKSRTKSRG